MAVAKRAMRACWVWGPQGKLREWCADAGRGAHGAWCPSGGWSYGVVAQGAHIKFASPKYRFAPLHPKAVKRKSKGAFKFALQESRLKKKSCFLDRILCFDFWVLRGKSQSQKSNQTYTQCTLVRVFLKSFKNIYGIKFPLLHPNTLSHDFLDNALYS